MSDDGSGIWTLSQRRVLIALLVGLGVLLAWRLGRNTRYLPDPAPAVPSRAGEVVDRIDPNTASASTLAALPAIGEHRARRIVDYRERHRARFPDRPAFAKPNDLLKIDGIGPAMVATLEPYLMFPVPKPATTPLSASP